MLTLGTQRCEATATGDVRRHGQNPVEVFKLAYSKKGESFETKLPAKQYGEKWTLLAKEEVLRLQGWVHVHARAPWPVVVARSLPVARGRSQSEW